MRINLLARLLHQKSTYMCVNLLCVIINKTLTLMFSILNLQLHDKFQKYRLYAQI
jgi:hypothetical protein